CNRLPGPDCKLGTFENLKGDIALPIMTIHSVQVEDRRLLGTADGSTFFRLAGALAIVERATHSAAPRLDRGAQPAKQDRASPRATVPAPLPPPPWFHRRRDRLAAWKENKARARTARYWSATTR